MKVCWLSNYYSPYKIKLFNELSKQIDLTAVFVGGSSDDNRNGEWSLKNALFKYVLLSNNNIDIKNIVVENDVLIDSIYLSKFGIKFVNEFKKQNKKVIMQADGGIAKNRGFIVNKIMNVLMNRHDYFISSSIFTNKYFEYYGVNKNNIFTYKFSSLTNKDISNNKKLIKDKCDFRKELNIDDKFTLISVGQPIDRKGFDILLKAYLKTNLRDKINLYIIGGEPQDKVKKIVDENKLNNVHFIGLINSNELKKYYAASNAFILCTREDIWGLVIEEAMSFGLPVITSDNCVAGLHFNKLNECVSICKVNDIDAYAKKIVDLYENKELLNNSSKESIKTIEPYTIENSCKDILEILNSI